MNLFVLTPHHTPLPAFIKREGHNEAGLPHRVGIGHISSHALPGRLNRVPVRANAPPLGRHAPSRTGC